MNLKHKTVQNTFIVFAVTLFNRGLNFVTKIILARILFPEDFGLVAIAWVIINGITLFREMGIESALIYRKDKTREASDTAFIILPFIGLVLYSAIFLLAPYIAEFYGEETVGDIVRVSGVTLLFLSVSSVPLTLFSKELDFRKRMAPEVTSTVAYAVTTIAMALSGFRVWSIVYGGVMSGFVGLLTIWTITSYKPKIRFDKKIARELIGYGRYVLGAQIVIFILSNGDNAVIGKILGFTALGYYSMAYSIGNLPATSITHILGKILFPTYSKIQDDADKLKAMFLRIFRYVSVVTVPMSLAIFMLSPDFIEFILGSKWTPAIPALRILCLYGLIRSLNATTGGLFIATGEAKFQRDVSILQLVLFMLFVIPVTREYGLIGISVLVTLIMGVLAMSLSMRKLFQIIGIGKTHILKAIKAPAYASFVSAVLIVITQSLMPRSLTTLMLEACIFASSYFLLIYLVDRKIFTEIMGLVKEIKPME